ncbi:MAG: hypothetical protein M0Z99_01190 [Betaproteobacteria bacterium]|nr:hypothetical protein [Betaproteobacteria bacterium]
MDADASHLCTDGGLLRGVEDVDAMGQISAFGWNFPVQVEQTLGHCSGFVGSGTRISRNPVAGNADTMPSASMRSNSWQVRL